MKLPRSRPNDLHLILDSEAEAHERVGAISRLASDRDSSSLARLDSLLSDSSPSVRAASAGALLVFFRKEEYLGTFLGQLYGESRDPSEDYRADLVGHLAHFAGKATPAQRLRIVHALRDLLAIEDSNFVQAVTYRELLRVYSPFADLKLPFPFDPERHIDQRVVLGIVRRAEGETTE